MQTNTPGKDTVGSLRLLTAEHEDTFDDSIVCSLQRTTSVQPILWESCEMLYKIVKKSILIDQTKKIFMTQVQYISFFILASVVLFVLHAEGVLT